MKRSLVFALIAASGFLFSASSIWTGPQAARAAEAAEIVKPKFERQEIDRIQIGYGLVIGDVDGDKKPDILLADKKDFAWYKNPGAKDGGKWQKHIMVTNLTQRDNVCIDALDINGDGQVEVAVGAMWNPGETNSDKLSGSVHYLIRPKDPTQKWTPVKLHNEPTIHRMRWVEVGDKKFQLVVLPLHGRGNKGGAGAGVKVLAYDVPKDPSDANAKWKTTVIDDTMHLTHNFDVIKLTLPSGDKVSAIMVAGKEGVKGIPAMPTGWLKRPKLPQNLKNAGGEVRVKPAGNKDEYIYSAVIEPMHGNSVVMYTRKNGPKKPLKRIVLDTTLRQGHALAIADLLGIGRPQVIAGWRNPNSDKKVGIKIYVPRDDAFEKFDTYLIDDNKMACEDLKLADLNGDGKLDIIAAGRGTKNLVIYWNRTGE